MLCSPLMESNVKSKVRVNHTKNSNEMDIMEYHMWKYVVKQGLRF